MTKEEIDNLTLLLNKYLKTKHGVYGKSAPIKLKYPDGLSKPDKERFKLIRVLKKHFKESDIKNLFLLSSRVHREILDLNEFTENLKRLNLKHDLELRTRFLLAHQPEFLIKKQKYYSVQQVSQFYGYKSTKPILSKIKNGELKAENHSLKKGENDNKDWRIPYSELFGQGDFPFFSE